MVNQAREQSMELAPVGGWQGRDKRRLRSFDALIEAFQRAGAGGRQGAEDAPLVILCAHAREQAIAFELTQQRMHVTAVNRQAPAEGGLAVGPAFGEGAQHDEMLAAQAVVRECVGDEASGGGGELAREPAWQLPDPLGRLVRGCVGYVGSHVFS